ncbi:fimbrial protein [Enterobacter quasiroggenkampii]|uniref:fimbrial protein n=1 Tax=Enterobacter quasiroggenkampii TaxID=2497436 RepID=UPI0021D27CE7|nr:fimbrial protein [Enterobacter quasiroggenkampii]MCU6349115.1 fimbrial protein [Enterobacter quasiroggenkampii]
MKKVITLFTALLLVGWSMNIWAFTCKTNAGATIPAGGGSANVYVDLPTTVQFTPIYNLAEIDLSNYIFCRTDVMGVTDTVTLSQAINFNSLRGRLIAYMHPDGPNMGGNTLPIYIEDYPASYWASRYAPWRMWFNIKAQRNFTGTAISAGTLVAAVTMRQTSSANSNVATYTWNLYANNTMTVTAGGCDVSARDVAVTLPEYPGETTVPVTVRCGQNQILSYYLSGTTVDSTNSIFTNTASASPAQGIGVQMTRNGTVVPANSNVSLGTVGTSPVNLGLTASYARTSGQVTAGNVQSIIGVTFVYQ